MKIFGTDGIRGKAGKFPITPEDTYTLGYLFAKLLNHKNLAVGWDTRESSFWIANALISGIKDAGSKVYQIGCVPTPVLSFLINRNFDGGIMITASHNPFSDNGLKFFNSNGEKISDEEEQKITDEFLDTNLKPKISEKIPAILFFEEKICEEYFKYLESVIDLKEIRQTYPVDCANGATSLFIKYAEKRLNLNFNPYNNQPDGKNINLKCGAAQPEFIKNRSFAFDGDGDRIIGKDSNGNIINGDTTLMFLADNLNLKKLVGTIMTNMAVEAFCNERGIEFHRTKVGDRFVKEKINRINAKLGGETSGHIIYTELNHTGDGFAIYIKLIELLNKLGLSIDNLTKQYRLFPQKVININVQEKKPFNEIQGFDELIKNCEIILGKNGRVFPRYSGTENLLRILIECQNRDNLEKVEYEINEYFNKNGGMQ